MLQDVVKEYILNCFPEYNDREMAGINNIKLDTIIFCTNRRKLDKYLDDLLSDFDVADSIENVINMKNRIEIRFKDGRKIVSTSYHETAKGFRFNRLIMDLDNLTCNNIFDHVIRPMGYACSRENVSFI